MGKIKYCIFDLDGTLLNTLETIRYYLNKTMADLGLDGIDTDECRRFIGDGARKLIYRSLESRGITDTEVAEKALAAYTAEYDSAPTYLTAVYDGIYELLERLGGEGVVVGVLSNKPDFATRSVVREFFGDSFAFVRGGTDGVPLKPAPGAALALLDEMGGSPDECAFIGDTAVDIHTGRNMGAALTVGVLWGFRDMDELVLAGADAIASTPSEICAMITNAPTNGIPC